jgi:SAM-dependent methyltransferase
MQTVSDVANPDLLSRIPLTARTLLDVGCGRGALGAAYRKLNPKARLFGIEIDPAAAMIAAGRMDHVANVDAENHPLPFALDEPIDCIIYGDTLEHMRDPLLLLRAQLPVLAANGTVLVCLPNVEHWTFVARLLAGNWHYESDGLLDQTHLRWFTLRTMQKLLEDAGLVPHDVVPRVFDQAANQDFVTRIAPALEQLGIDPNEYARRSQPLQYVWRAQRRPPNRFGLAAHMLEPQGGVSHVRVLQPVAAMSTDSELVPVVVQDMTIPDFATDMPKVLVLHRVALAGAGGRNMIRTALAMNYLLVLEFDDHPDFFSKLQAPDLLSFAAVHAVQTTTSALADVLRPRNPNVAVFPNAINALPDIRNFTDPKRLTLFFGAFNREADWSPYIDVLNEVAALCGSRLHFSIMYDRLLFNALSAQHKSFAPLADYETYLEALGRAEISFMPLANNEFNRSKSDLKYIEAAAARVMPLASPTVYADSIRDGETGVLFRSPGDLRDRLLSLVADPDLARGIADAARADIAEHRMLAYQTGARIGWYRTLWAHRAELTAALLARVPDLARSEAELAAADV